VKDKFINICLPECDDGVGDRPTDDEGGGRVQRELGYVAHARRQPNIRERNLHREKYRVEFDSILSFLKKISFNPKIILFGRLKKGYFYYPYD